MRQGWFFSRSLLAICMYFAIIKSVESAIFMTHALLIMYGLISITMLSDSMKRKMYKRGPPTHPYLWMAVEWAISLSLILGDMIYLGAMYSVIIYVQIVIFDDTLINRRNK